MKTQEKENKMDFIDPNKVKSIKTARPHLLALQKRILQLEDLLDDLARSVEIAQHSRQYNITEVFVQQSMEALEDRLVLPTEETTSDKLKWKVIEGVDESTVDKVNDAEVFDEKVEGIAVLETHQVPVTKDA